MKTYFISGANRGIGLEMTTQLLNAGERVLATARSLEKSKELIQLKEKVSSRLEIYVLDVTSDKSVQELPRQVGDQTIDVLINNAGVYLDGKHTLASLPLKLVEETFQANTFGPLRVTQALLKNLEKSSNPKLVSITSLMGSIGDNGSGRSYAYRMSKAALNMFNKSFSVDFPKITALVLHPGWVQTEMGGSQAPTQPEESAEGILKVIQRSTLKDTGKFFDFEGDELPW